MRFPEHEIEKYRELSIKEALLSFYPLKKAFNAPSCRYSEKTLKPYSLKCHSLLFSLYTQLLL